MKKDLTILVAEDEPSIADNILFALKQEGYQAQHVSLGQDAIDAIETLKPALLILDVGLPDISGFDVCKNIRKFSDLPIIFLTARSDEIDRVVGLEIGGDDYVTKPFSSRELLARIKLRLRNSTVEQAKPSLANGHFLIDEARKKITFHGCELNLTAFEFGILKTLLSQPERVYSREQLLTSVRDIPEVVLERSIDNHIKTLRAKLKEIDNASSPIITHRGIGYSISP